MKKIVIQYSFIDLSELCSVEPSLYFCFVFSGVLKVAVFLMAAHRSMEAGADGLQPTVLALILVEEGCSTDKERVQIHREYPYSYFFFVTH